MQNNVTELTERLLRALDTNYNVVDMPEVVNIISLLEKVAITKELLGTTRLGKYVNELRRKTTNQELWRRAKELLKKWRSMVLPEANGQIRPPAPAPAPNVPTPNQASPPLQGQSLMPRINPVPPKKVSPPIVTQEMAIPALQQRLVSPGVQRLVSPSLPGPRPPSRLVSPQIQKKLVSPHGQMVSPGLLAPKLVSPHNKRVSPGLQAHNLVSPHKMVSPGGQKVSPHKVVSPGDRKVSPELPAQVQGQQLGGISPPLTAGQNAEVPLNQLKNKKRPAGESLDHVNAKRSRLNGGVTDLEFSDSSNSSFKDVILTSALKPNVKRDVIVINSDSNSSFAERTNDPLVDQQQPKKRGRKKGSKNHKNLLDEAETSFTNKLAVSASRGGSKVKTTQEILAGIQNKNTVSALSAAAGLKPSKEDLEEKAAKLTERVSIIDRKLNANAHRNKNSQKNKLSLSAGKPNERVIESGSVINDKSLLRRLKQQQQEEDEDEEIVVVDDVESAGSRTEESQETDASGLPRDLEITGVRALSEKEALALLPPIDKSVLDEVYLEPPCTCRVKENKPNDFSIGEEEDEETEQPPPFEMVEDPTCPAKEYFATKYRVDDVSEEKVLRLNEACLPNVNGNWSLGTSRPESQKADSGLYVNVVPNIYERLDKDVRPLDSFKKYSVSEGGCSTGVSNSVIKTEPEERTVVGGVADVSDSVIKSEAQDPELKPDNSDESDIRTEPQDVFREWYECLDRPSYNGETLRILPYCIVD